MGYIAREGNIAITLHFLPCTDIIFDLIYYRPTGVPDLMSFWSTPSLVTLMTTKLLKLNTNKMYRHTAREGNIANNLHFLPKLPCTDIMFHLIYYTGVPNLMLFWSTPGDTYETKLLKLKQYYKM